MSCGSCECPKLRKRLVDAGDAYHDLVTGRKATSITTGSETVTYSNSRTGKSDLKIYMTELNQQLAACPTCANPGAQSARNARRAFKPGFGG